MDEQGLQVLDPNHQTPATPVNDYQSNVDASRPFRSVKEAVAIFGERILVGEVYSPKPFSLSNKEVPIFSPSPKKVHKGPSTSGSSSIDRIYEKFTGNSSSRTSSYEQDNALYEAVKKLEAELEETKAELKLLKERESETEVAVATLNAELHKNMSKMARAEADVAGKAVLASRSVSVRSVEGNDGGIVSADEKKKDEVLWSESMKLAEILNLGDKEGLFLGRKLKERKVVIKKKPIIPLVVDLFSRKKGSSTSLHNTDYTSPLQWN